MGIRIWLDDNIEAEETQMPEGFDFWATNAYICMGLIISGKVDYVSFDHDLGLFNDELDKNNTGYAVAKLIELLAFRKEIPKIDYDVHSKNSNGRRNIELAMQSANRFWDMMEEKEN